MSPETLKKIFILLKQLIKDEKMFFIKLIIWEKVILLNKHLMEVIFLPEQTLLETILQVIWLLPKLILLEDRNGAKAMEANTMTKHFVSGKRVTAVMSFLVTAQ